MTRQSSSAKRKPDFAARVQINPTVKRSGFTTIDAAWKREIGGIYIKLTGKQLVDAPIYLFASDEPEGD